jgi:hypothetical protein
VAVRIDDLIVEGVEDTRPIIGGPVLISASGRRPIIVQ